jgi:hypothetical protein
MALGNKSGVSDNRSGLASLVGVTRYIGVSVGEIIAAAIAGEYFTDDAMANAYYTDDAMANRYVSND